MIGLDNLSVDEKVVAVLALWGAFVLLAAVLREDWKPGTHVASRHPLVLGTVWMMFAGGLQGLAVVTWWGLRWLAGGAA